MRFMGGHPLLPNPDYIPHQGMISSIHEPQKYIEEGLLYILPGKSIDNDGHKDLLILCERFPDAKVEELELIEAGGELYKFIDKKWVKQD